MNFLANLRYALRYLADPKVPLRRKVWPCLVLLYFLSPIDFLPDLFPGIGWLDDLVVLFVGLAWFSRELQGYRGGTGGQCAGAEQTIDVEYAVCPDEDPGDRDSSPEH